jgi:hypothetical protein
MQHRTDSHRIGGDAVKVILWVLIGLVVLIAIAIGLQLPEIRRYLKVRSM